ncbi:MAG: peptidase domain-containing ABC transporter [Vulcanococcus sp.]|uniref:peptidase domain-containing ABC transporter n=1 Tax=Vulcanococcus sp. TaxID=2856995 RepID=UPI0025F8C8DA|nr:peptidase domain-containing ABC transporter [Vulcanococcus sp.]MBW0166189.1 peptidase domain-containing ABC transporter [Vulcanococcus sp.]
MQLTLALRLVSSWEPFSKLPRSAQARVAESLQALQLRPGQKLYDYNSLPPGVALLAKGQMRLLALDEQDVPFTLRRLSPGDTAGDISLLRGVAGQALAASQPSQLWLMPQAVFLQVVLEHAPLQLALAKPSLDELFAVAAASPAPRLPKRRDLRDWASNQLEEAPGEQQVLLLPPGEHHFGSSWGPWLVSSSNVAGANPGEELLGPLKLTVKGKLPARLLAKQGATPPMERPPVLVLSPEAGEEASETTEAELLEPDWQESSAAIVAVERQQEALEDWYGRLGDDGTYPHLTGDGPVEGPLAALRMLARYFDLPFRKDVLTRILEDQIKRDSSGAGIGLLQLAAIADLMGLRASQLNVNDAQIPRLQLPALVMGVNGPLVVWSSDMAGQVLISDPSSGQGPVAISALEGRDEEGRLPVLCIERSQKTPKKRFGLAWFLPALKQHKGVLLQVLVASFFVQLFGLLNPLLIQQIIDAVISQGNVSTLNVLGTLLVAMSLAQAVLSSLRTYLFSDTTNRIDISLGSTIIDHLLRLPLGYFADRPVGEVSSRLNELQKIRRFLTGTALTVILDAVFAVIYIAVMLLYSVQLTFWALAVVPLFVGLTALTAPVIRRQLREQAEANSRVQSHLVETLGGMETIKGQSMEIHSRWRWQQLYGGQIQSGFRNVVTSTAAGSASQFLEQLSGLIVLWIGASLVLKGQLSLGQLIAFRILAGYVTSPLLRMANLWQSFQETSLSLERLADIVDHPQELEITGQQKPPIPPIVGQVEYSGVSFRFAEQGKLQLKNVSCEIAAGSFVGVVGSSGSGKSTMLKLLTRLYEPEEGLIRIDGNDISKVDLYSLRAQIGVVPQDSLLFDGTILSNIALTRPDASFEDVVLAAQVACAHDFIQSMPSGYSSSVGERGAGLSGGQRQRLAIARMILRRPRLLVLDEATSALDVDTERRLTANLMDLYKGSTVFFITHRLASLKAADHILVMDQGALVEQGTHEELMSLDGRYATLYHQQEV